MKILREIRRKIRWLFRKRRRDRSLLFTRDNIRIDRDIDYDENGACAYIEVWFDAERKFGLWLPDEDYVNVYAFLNLRTGEMKVCYIIYYADDDIDGEYKYKGLTQGEIDLIRELMEEVSLKETGISVKSNWLIVNDECPLMSDITMYSAVSSKDFAVEVKNALGIEITEQQSDILINYMEGSGYALGTCDRNLYRIEINEEDGEIEPYSVEEAAFVILTWMEDFVQDFGVTSMDDYTLADMEDEGSYNSWRGGIYGSWAERERCRKYLRQLKVDEMELQALSVN